MTERRSRAALTLLLLAVFIYLITLSTHSSSGEEQTITLVMSASEARALMAGRVPHSLSQPQDVVQPAHDLAQPPPSAHNTTPQSPDKTQTLDFVVIRNRVYFNRSAAQVEQIKKSIPVRKTEEKKWSKKLELSAGAALMLQDFSKYEPEEREFMESRVQEMVERTRQVRKACQVKPKLEPVSSHMVWDDKHSVVWCPNYKVASTTWMINFLKLAHFNDDNPAIPDVPPEEKEKLKYLPKYGARHDVVNDIYPVPPTPALKLEFLKKSFRVIIVRHPFTRILSAYRDKMTKEHPLPPKFGFKKLQQDIMAKYRTHNSSESYPFPTFAEFVQYIIDTTANFTSIQQWRKNVKCWVPYWAQCGVCTNDFNVIMKLETMADDERFFITLANLEELKTAGEWRHLRNVSSSQAAPQYYTQLTRRQMLDLYHRYQLDFDLFGYNVDEYLPMAKDHASLH